MLHITTTSKLEDDVYCKIFYVGQWRLTKGSLIVARVRKTCSLCSLQAYISTNFVNAVESARAFEVNSIGGALYFVTFIDDYSRKL